MTLHCPWCGEVLSRDDAGELRCVTGDMGMTEVLEQRLTQVFEDETHLPKPSIFDNMIWYCAGCGQELQRDADGLARCPSCRRTMGEFTYALVEFHPHNLPKVRHE